MQLLDVSSGILVGTILVECLLLYLNHLLSRDRARAPLLPSYQKAPFPRWIVRSFPLAVTWAVRPAVNAQSMDPSLLHVRGHLAELPPRTASSEPLSLDDTVHRSMQRQIVALAEENPTALYLGRSTFESTVGDISLFAKRMGFDGKTEWRGKILQTSDADERLRVRLHPADAKHVSDVGWGQEQRSHWISSQWVLSKPELRWVEIRMPRNQEEAEVVKQTVRAAVLWALVEAAGDEEQIYEGNKVEDSDSCHSQLFIQPVSKLVKNRSTST